jgi:putative flippase GtrA
MSDSLVGPKSGGLDPLTKTFNLFWDVRFVRYIAAGGISFLVDYGLLIGLTEIFAIHYLISASIGFTVGALVCYGLSIFWVFDARRYEQRMTEAVLFFFIGIVGLGLNDLLLWGLTEGLGWPYRYCKLIVAGLVLVFNYSARLLLLFTASNAPTRPS